MTDVVKIPRNKIIKKEPIVEPTPPNPEMIVEPTTKLSFKVDRRNNLLDGLTLYEEVDRETLRKLIHSNLLRVEFHNPIAQIHYENEKKQLQYYFANRDWQKNQSNDKNILIKVLYKRSKGNPYGRSNPVRALGLFSIRREIRHTLASSIYMDIDIKNCHPEILNQLCEAENVNCMELRDYVNNRQVYFDLVTSAYKCSEEDAKFAFILYSYGGGFDTWCKKCNIKPNLCRNDLVSVHDGIATIKELMEMAKFRDAIRKVHKLITKKNDDLVDVVKKIKNEKGIEHYNLQGSVCSFVLQEYEVRCLEQLYIYCVEKGFISVKDGNAVLCADGLMIKKEFYTPELLNEFERIIQEKIGLKLKFVNKPMKQGYEDILDNNLVDYDPNGCEIPPTVKNVNELNTVYADNDNECAKIVYKMIQNEFFYCRGHFFLKMGHLWTNSTETIEAYLISFVMKQNIWKPTNGGDKQTWTSYTNAKNIYKVLCNMAIINPKPDLYQLFHSSTRGRLCFEDGVLDIPTKSFYTWKEWYALDIEYYPIVMIRRTFETFFKNPNRKLINDIKEKIFHNLFGEGLKTALHHISRGIAGFYIDKNMLVYCGNRDCGKSLFYDAIKSAFEAYVSTFELGNILYVRDKSGANEEVSRKLYWLLDLEFVRLAVSQEIPDPSTGLKANSKVLKKITGGGDEIVARRNFDRTDAHITLDTTFMALGNSQFKTDSPDCNEHIIELSNVVQFITENELEELKKTEGVDELELSRYKIKDPEIKNNIHQEDWKNAIVYLLMESFVDRPVDIVKNEENGAVPLLRVIRNDFIITGDKNDIIPCEKVYDVFKTFDKKKIDIELKSAGIEKKKSRIRSKYYNMMCFYGLKQRIVINIEPDYNSSNNGNVEPDNNSSSDNDVEFEEI